MKLSIIIICLNEEQHLSRCLQSIEQLDHAGLDVEVIVVDGGSTDQSRKIARTHGAHLVTCPRGIPLGRNAGARAAQGEILAYVDADVELLEGWFANVAQHFAQHTRLVLGAPPRLPADASWIARAYALHWGPPPGGHLKETEGIRLLSTHCLALGREVFDCVGGFQENLAVDEDTVLILKAKSLGFLTICDLDFGYIHYGEPRTIGEFFQRTIWGANYTEWLEAIRRGDLGEAWRPQYVYGTLVGVEMACLGLSLALPLGGWQLGIPTSLGLLSATTFLPALQTAHRHKAYGRLGALWLMYGTYGLATAAAMLGAGRDKTRRWR